MQVEAAGRLSGVVTDAPETHFTRSADGTNLDYQMSGDGPLDLVFMYGLDIPIDLLSEDTGFTRIRRRLGAFSRTVWFDLRGYGASEELLAPIVRSFSRQTRCMVRARRLRLQHFQGPCAHPGRLDSRSR